MLEVHCGPHLEKVRAHADSLGPDIREQLEGKLSYLENFRGGECLCELFYDLAPHSFYFNLLGAPDAEGKRSLVFNGGLIFHAARSTGAGAPEFAVTLDPQDKPHWQVHT
jgi:hypothetical protein